MNIDQKTEDNIELFIDESYDEQYCAVCIVCIQGKENLVLVRDLIRQMSIDPLIQSMVREETYHYSELSIGARQALTSWVARMPLSVYIAITQQDIPQDKKYDTAYGFLLKNILIPVFSKFQNRVGSEVALQINFENISDKTKSDVEFFTKKVNDTGIKGKCNLNVVTKQTNDFIFLPDFFLGYVKDHINRGGEKITWTADSLKLLSKKIGLLLNYEKDGKLERFSRGEEVSTFLS